MKMRKIYLIIILLLTSCTNINYLNQSADVKPKEFASEFFNEYDWLYPPTFKDDGSFYFAYKDAEGYSTIVSVDNLIKTELELPFISVMEPVLSDDQKSLFFAGQEDEFSRKPDDLYVLNLNTYDVIPFEYNSDKTEYFLTNDKDDFYYSVEGFGIYLNGESMGLDYSASHPYFHNDYLYFDQHNGGNGKDLYRHNLLSNETEELELLNSEFNDQMPIISPDGKHIFFVREIDGIRKIYWSILP
jgi:hypothetical protein